MTLLLPQIFFPIIFLHFTATVATIKRSKTLLKKKSSKAIVVVHLEENGAVSPYLKSEFERLKKERSNTFHRFIERAFINGRRATVLVTAIKNGDFSNTFHGISILSATYAYLDNGAIYPNKTMSQNEKFDVQECRIYEYISIDGPVIVWGNYRGTITLKSNKSQLDVYVIVQVLKTPFTIDHLKFEHDKRVRNGRFLAMCEHGKIKGVDVAFLAYEPKDDEEKKFIELKYV